MRSTDVHAYTNNSEQGLLTIMYKFQRSSGASFPVRCDEDEKQHLTSLQLSNDKKLVLYGYFKQV